MAGNCGVCNSVISVQDQDIVKCTGTCDRAFHIRCVPGDSVKTRGNKKEWCCDKCKKLASRVKPVMQPVSGDAAVTQEFLVKTLHSFKEEMMSELKIHTLQFEQFKESIDVFSHTIDEATKLMEETNKRLSRVEKENQQLRERNTQLEVNVKDLMVRVRNMEQYSRKNNIEISGIPVTKEENVFDVLKDVGAAIGVEMKTEEIQAAHRVPTFKSERIQPLVVQFTSRATRESWLRGYRQHKDLTAHTINRSFPQRKVFINEHLTPENKVLLARTKEVGKSQGFKFIWCREGKIFVRKGEGQKCIKIECVEDLAKLK